MEKVLVTTIHLQLPFSLSLCNPLFHLTEAGNVKTKPSTPDTQQRGCQTHCADSLLPPSGGNHFMGGGRLGGSSCFLILWGRKCRYGIRACFAFFARKNSDACHLLPASGLSPSYSVWSLEQQMQHQSEGWSEMQSPGFQPRSSKTEPAFYKIPGN